MPRISYVRTARRRTGYPLVLGFAALVLALCPSGGLAAQFPGAQGGRGSAGIQGRVVSDSPQSLEHPIEVRLEGVSLEVRARAFTDGLGNFTFNASEAGSASSASFIVVEVDGFMPVRQRIEPTPAFARGRILTTVILERAAELPPAGDTPGTGGGSSGVVDLRQLTSEIPRQSVEAFEQAAEASRIGDHERAVTHLTYALELAPDYYDAQNALGFEYARLGRIEDAMRRFRIAAELNPNAPQPRISLGMLLLRENEVLNRTRQTDDAEETLGDALVVLEEAVVLDPLSASARYLHGTALYRAGENQRALDTLQRALGLTPPVPDVRIMLYNVYVAEREFGLALEQVTFFLEEYPDSPNREAVEKMKSELELLVPR